MNGVRFDRRHNKPGTPLVVTHPQRLQSELSRMDQPAYLLDEPQRSRVLGVIVEVCATRQWNLLAAHVRENHVHVVVSGVEQPEKMMNAFKSYASRCLNETDPDGQGRKRWSRHGSTRYLWDRKAIEYAVHYVVAEQGDPMAVYDCRQNEPNLRGTNDSEPRP